MRQIQHIYYCASVMSMLFIVFNHYKLLGYEEAQGYLLGIDDENSAHQNRPENISRMGEQGIVKHSSMGGRLGNQLFEHAATLAIAKATGKQACVFGENVDLIDEHFLSDGEFLRKCGETVTSHRVHETGYAIFSPLPKTEKSLQL